ncbi:hypothetical protein [Peptoniphilus indolicus]|uniref:Uncharacterized protein n=1 Tax=Peptoniphilus indolicus ATCC 29427 TaxID=997350 RepID=G4D519_9FIRM|nr:hypothetical protein [Peptoniphilus indolicus]EGY79382.1 hypothetical protein HMPREF9129_1499 [Peptoniphilus indolicus ATCC 29427]
MKPIFLSGTLLLKNERKFWCRIKIFAPNIFYEESIRYNLISELKTEVADD